MAESSFDFRFTATGIGSVPFMNIETACRDIHRLFPDMPFWPQFVKRSYFEDMSVQYSEGLPLLDVNQKERTLRVSSSGDREATLVTFYERFFSEDVDAFGISEEYAPGLYGLLRTLEKEAPENARYIKGQSVGPITFTSGILGTDGKPVIHDPELSEALIRGLAIKALWQVRMLETSGRFPIVFLDEPSLSGFGSAFSTIDRQDVIDKLQLVVTYLKEHAQCLVGIHCCGNTDWSMILAAAPDIINFDAYEFMDHFLLYPDDIASFLKGGGAIAWGIVPTAGFTGNESTNGLLAQINEGIMRMEAKGVSREMIAKSSIITPSCGMGSMDGEDARSAMDLLGRLQSALMN